MLFSLGALLQITKRSMETGNQKAALVPLISGNLVSLVLLIKKMTSLQYSERGGDQPGHFLGDTSHLSSETHKICQRYSHWFGPAGAES